MPCQLVSWYAFYQLCCELAERIRQSGYQFDTLLAIGRGGYMPARVLSDLLGNMNLISFKIEHYRGAHKSSRAVVTYPLLNNIDLKKVLLVDDVSDSGSTFDLAMDHIRQCATVEEVRTAVLHHKKISSVKPDYFAEEISQWRWIIYPWAVSEDLSSIITTMSLRSDAIADIQQKLLELHGIKVSQDQVERALKL